MIKLNLIGIAIIVVITLLLVFLANKKEPFTKFELDSPIRYYPDNLEQCDYFCDYFETVNCPWTKGDCSQVGASCLNQCRSHFLGKS